MTNSGRPTFQPFKPIVPAKRRSVRGGLRGTSRSKVFITNLSAVQEDPNSPDTTQDRSETKESLPSFDASFATVSNSQHNNMSSQGNVRHPTSTSFPYPPAEAAAQSLFPHQTHQPHQMPNFSTPSRFPQGPPFFRGPSRDHGNQRMAFRVAPRGYPHTPTRRPLIHPTHGMPGGMPGPHGPYPMPGWPAFRGPPPGPVSQWKAQPAGYQPPNNTSGSMAKGASSSVASEPPTCESSKKAARLLLDTALDIVTTCSVESQDDKPNRKSTDAETMKPPPTPLTPIRKIVCHDLEGKKLVQAVSASPSSVHSGKQPEVSRQVEEEEYNGKSQIPDSPGQAFLSFIDDMSESNGGLTMDENSIARQLGSIDNFNFLPYLEEDSGQKTCSPPMIPFLSKSPQLSWEMTEEDSAAAFNASSHVGNVQEPAKQDLQHQPKPSDPLTRANLSFERTASSAAQSVFRRGGTPARLGGNGDDSDRARLEPEGDIGRVQRSWSDQSSLGYEREAARQMSRDDMDSKADESETTSAREAPQMPSLPHRQIPPPPFPGGNFQRLPQSTQIQPRPATSAFARPPPSFAMPHSSGSGAGSNAAKPSYVPGIETSRSFPSHQMYPIRPPQNSKERCIPLTNPVPTVHFGSSPGQANDQTLPEFSELVNFPNNLRQTRSLPVGMRCCVMCGGIRPTCSRIRSRKNKGLSPSREMSAMSCDDFVTIPTQNKGLCTICDISVWVVKESGCQIKWCKGCKNFRQWASFGEKGFATKCARCRERQREKYALLKDAKMRGQNGNQMKGAPRKGGR
ncbi:expressed unknown protein [Seminavis robusta]|uniref:Uncharacterized protein n=1 Tax=Seminavis robusta TaxID=568900 RepID=A0A9N8D9Q3_9STRA|nr:expressed unknown protein [Seminavis robusta]|eukprot:Sro6_g004910.1 n/a (794) ;mRNA; r:46058-48516